MPKFWAYCSSSSEEDCESDSNDGYGNGGGPMKSNTSPSSDVPSVPSSPVPPSETARQFSTPPRQPILPVDDPTEAWDRSRPHQAFATVPTRTGGPYDPSTHTRIACISDTHGYHRSIPVPQCDILIHGGDFTNFGEPDMVKDVSDYFADLLRNGTVRDRVICIAGNHELTFEPDHYDRVWRQFRRPRQSDKFDAEAARKGLTNCTYLEDDAFTEGPIHFYGSPWQPEFYNWAFNVPRADIESKWEQIPSDTDVLITHGPPLGRGDETSSGERVGCVTLMREVQARVKPRLHVFGHVHEGYGITHDGKTMYVNASSVSQNYTRQNPAIVVDLPHHQSTPALLVKSDCRLDADEVLVWLKQNGYENLVPRFEGLKDRLTGSDIIEFSHEELCCHLLIHRDEEAKVELKRAMEMLWIESFR